MDVVHCVLQFGAVVDVEVIDDFLWYAWSWTTTMKLSCEHALLFIRSPKAVFTHVLARHLTGGILGRKLVRACSRNDEFCAAHISMSAHISAGHSINSQVVAARLIFHVVDVIFNFTLCCCCFFDTASSIAPISISSFLYDLIKIFLHVLYACS